MKRLIRNNKGFTLAEMVIAGALAGLIGLVAVTSLKNTRQASNIAVVGSEASTLKSLIVAQLASPAGCQKNFPAGTPLVRPDSVEIVTSRGTVVAKKDLTFGPTREFSITNISYAAAAGSNILKIKVDYAMKASLDRAGKRAHSFTVDLFINKNDAGTAISGCFIDIAGATRKAIKLSCDGIGAVYDANGGMFGTCIHPLPEVRDKDGVVTSLCPTGQYLKKVTLENEVPGVSPNKVILQCRPFAMGPCGPWSYVNKIGGTENAAECVSMSQFFAAGEVITTLDTKVPTYKPLSIKCPDADEVLRKVEDNGDLTCIPKHIKTTCGPNEYVYDIVKISKDEFKGSCKTIVKLAGCAAGEYLQAAQSDGSPAPGGCVKPILPSAFCPVGKVMIGLNADGSSKCQDM